MARVWFEGGDKGRWILMDCFRFLEVISPRMRHGNQNSELSFASTPPSLTTLSAIGKENVAQTGENLERNLAHLAVFQ